MTTTAIILAGGLGTRLRSVVPNLPKPMAPLNGRPFLEYQLDYWIAQGVHHFILSVGYRKEAIIAHFGETYCGARIQYVTETEPLGTGGGLLLAMEALPGDEPFLLLNGDTFFEVSLNEIKAFHAARQSDWTFLLFRTSEMDRYMGLDLDMDDRIISLSTASSNGESLANGGVYLISPNIVRRCEFPLDEQISLEERIIPDIMEIGGKVFGLECKGQFIDIGIPEDYQRAANMLAFKVETS